MIFKLKYILLFFVWILCCFINSTQAIKVNTLVHPTPKTLFNSSLQLYSGIATASSSDLSETFIPRTFFIGSTRLFALQEQGLGGRTLQGVANILNNLTEEEKQLLDSLFNNDVAFSLPEAIPTEVLAPEREGEIKTTIEYSSEDTIRFDMREKKMSLYGGTVINYQDVKLEAGKTSLNWATRTIEATGREDTTGVRREKPVFTEGNEQYLAEAIKYNFQSKKAIIDKGAKKQDEGIIYSEKVKKDEKNNIYMRHGRYTTCNLTEPHFYIKAGKLKLIPDDKIISGPFNLYFSDIPTPLGFFLGILSIKKRASGIILPGYSEDRRGFYLKEGGYYFAFNDYIHLKLLGSVYSKGASDFLAFLYYKKRYRYSGELFYQHSNEKGISEEDTSEKKSFQFKWKHQTEQTRTRNSSLIGDVTIQSKSFRARNILPEENIHSNLTSDIRYTNGLRNFPYVLSTSLHYTQNLHTQIANLTFPEGSLRTNNIYPFRRKGDIGSKWPKNIFFQHTFSFQNKISNVVGEDKVDVQFSTLPKLFNEGNYGMQHTLPVKMSMKVLKYFNLMPQLQYTERWYFKKLAYRYDPTLKKAMADTIPGFSRVWDYQMGTSLRTTLYGIHLFSPNAKIQAIRHQLDPSIHFTYTPDFSSERFGYWQMVRVNEAGSIEKRSRFDKFIYGAPINRASAKVDISLENTLWMKIKCKKAARAANKKVPILEGFNLSTSYDFLADSFPLSDIEFNTRTYLLDKLINLQLRATFDPYLYKFIGKAYDSWGRLHVKQEKVDEFAWNHGKGLGQVKEAYLSMAVNFNARSKKLELGKDSFSKLDHPKELAYVENNPEHYVDFKIPWQLGLNYILLYTKEGFNPQDVQQTISFNGELSLTEKLKVNFSSAYDIEKKDLVGAVTRVELYRDLHCWEMHLSWRPIGPFQSYEFYIRPKALTLRDLKYVKSSRNRAISTLD